AGVAERLGVHDTVSRLSARAASSGVHDERDRSAKPAAAQSDQDKRSFPQRGGGPQTDLSRHRQRRAGVDANAQLDDSPARVQDPLRRPPTRVNRLHRKSDALSSDTKYANSPRPMFSAPTGW